MSGLERTRQAVADALAAGADSADAYMVQDDGVTVLVRDGRTERVERSMSQGIGVRAYRGTRLGIAYTNDASADAVREAARRAADLASVAAEDPAAGLPSGDDLGCLDTDLEGADSSASDWTAEGWIDLARRAEAAAREDDRITMSEGSRSGGGRRVVSLSNSVGFSGERTHTYCVVASGVFATGADGERQRDHWYTQATHRADLDSPESVGREAARRAIRRCGYRKPPSGPVPVILPPDITIDVMGSLAQAISAAVVYRRGSFLADRLGETMAAPTVSIVDDPTVPRAAGSRSFDGEGVRARRTVLFDQGRLTSWMADAYSSRRLGVATTGNASRSIASSPGVTPSNLVFQPGARAAKDIVAEVASGLYVTDLFGLGVNLASGAWSRGGCGMWIENGELTHAVQEFTMTGDLPGIMNGLSEAGSDLTWHGRSAAPTVRIDGLTVAAG